MSGIEFATPFCVLISIAGLCVHAGSLLSVSLPKDIQAKVTESIDGKGGLKMPLFATATLLLVYFAYKYLNGFVFKIMLHIYFAISVSTGFYGPVYWIIREYFSKYLQDKILFSFNSNEHKRTTEILRKTRVITSFQLELSLYGIFSFIISAALPISYSIIYWNEDDSGIILPTLLASMISISVIPSMRITKWVYGVILLSGLMVYDIFWVFGIRLKESSGNSIMEVVARNIKLPIKILVPRTLRSLFDKENYKNEGPMMLGLGDIVIPGSFLAMCKQIGKDISLPNGKPFVQLYRWGLFSYILALAITGMVLFLTKQGQPALLFISPILIITTFFTAFVHKRFNALLAWRAVELEDTEAQKDIIIQEEEEESKEVAEVEENQDK